METNERSILIKAMVDPGGTHSVWVELDGATEDDLNDAIREELGDDAPPTIKHAEIVEVDGFEGWDHDELKKMSLASLTSLSEAIGGHDEELCAIICKNCGGISTEHDYYDKQMGNYVGTYRDNSEFGSEWYDHYHDEELPWIIASNVLWEGVGERLLREGYWYAELESGAKAYFSNT